MLPDFPRQKAKLLKHLNTYLIRKQQEYLGVFNKIPSYTHHEGDRWSIEKEDGTVSEQMYQEVEAGFSIRRDETPNLTPERVMEELDKVAQEMAKQQVQGIVKKINQAVDESGRSIDAKGSPLTKELILQALDSVEFGFDENGRPELPALIMHPPGWAKYKDEIKLWEQDPEFNQRFKAMVEKKREGWRDRESRRKLVD